VDSITGEAVDAHDKARGYEVGEDRFLLVEDREIEQALPSASARLRFILMATRSARRVAFLRPRASPGG
jgi:non-homologous end joining protein Ku